MTKLEIKNPLIDIILEKLEGRKKKTLAELRHEGRNPENIYDTIYGYDSWKDSEEDLRELLNIFKGQILNGIVPEEGDRIWPPSSNYFIRIKEARYSFGGDYSIEGIFYVLVEDEDVD